LNTGTANIEILSENFTTNMEIFLTEGYYVDQMIKITIPDVESIGLPNITADGD
jgi:hypothetical protein